MSICWEDAIINLFPRTARLFDVAILPFVVNELTLAANPLKLREYLAAGLPVVATPLPEVVKLNGLVRTARTQEEFLDQIEAFLKRRQAGTEPRGLPADGTGIVGRESGRAELRSSLMWAQAAEGMARP